MMQSVPDDDVQKRHLEMPRLSWWRKVYSDWEDVTSSSRVFQLFRPAIGKEQLRAVDRLTGVR